MGLLDLPSKVLRDLCFIGVVETALGVLGVTDGAAACDGPWRMSILDEAGFLTGVLSFLCNNSERSVCMVPILSET